MRINKSRKHFFSPILLKIALFPPIYNILITVSDSSTPPAYTLSPFPYESSPFLCLTNKQLENKLPTENNKLKQKCNKIKKTHYKRSKQNKKKKKKNPPPKRHIKHTKMQRLLICTLRNS